MKIKTNKSVKKRFSLSKPHNRVNAKVFFEVPGYEKKMTKKRKFRVFRAHIARHLRSSTQAKKILEKLS